MATNRTLSTVGAMGVGMLAMYLLDPEQGRRRRALAADKMRSARARMEHLTDAARRDASNRGRGLFAALRSRMRSDEIATPYTLEQRVRARLGRAVSNPGAIDVSVQEGGKAVLAGPVLADEVADLMKAVWSVRGITGVENQLDIHATPGGISALQGARGNGGKRTAADWPPSVRVLAGAAGATAAVAGLVGRRPLGIVGTLLGSALLARSVTNKSLPDMVGMGGGKSVRVDKEMFIPASPDQLYEFWRRQDNFPRFMRNVQEVVAVGEDRWHWKVAGPMGSVEWDAEIVEDERNRRLVWRTLPGAMVESEGKVEFIPEVDGTRLRVNMSYAPAGGVVGHAVASLFGKDAKTEMDEDLMRLKAYFETGFPNRDVSSPAPASAPIQTPDSLLH